MKESKETILRARPKENGVVFYSNKIPILCYETLRDKEGKIKSRTRSSVVDRNEDFAEMYNESKGWNLGKEIKMARIVLLIMAAIITFITLNPIAMISGLYFSYYALANVVLLVHGSTEMKFGKHQKKARFHSAEHKVINAYQKKKRIPTIDEIRKSSSSSKECESRQIIDSTAKYVLASLALFMCQFINVKIYLIIVIALVAIILIDRKFAIFRPLQVLVTKKATDDELEVVLEGIKYFEKMENEIQESVLLKDIVV